MLKGKKINESVYDRLKEEVSNALVEAANAGEVSVNLQKYTDAFLSGSLSKGAYLNLIDGMWERGDLGDDQYLGQLKDLKDKGELNSTDFDQRSTKVQDKIIGSANSDTGDLPANIDDSSVVKMEKTQNETVKENNISLAGR